MKGVLAALLIVAAPSPSWAQGFAKLPSWARPVAEAASREKPPVDADAWVLLNRSEIIYTGMGEIRTRTFRLVHVLTEKGINQGTYVNKLSGGRDARILSLKGWNLRPDGEVETVSRGDLATFDPDGAGEVTSELLKAVSLPRLAKGSLVAFESEEKDRPTLGPILPMCPVEEVPVRRWELVRGDFGVLNRDQKAVPIRLSPRHWETWGLALETLPGGLAASGVRPYPKDEGALPAPDNVLPWVDLAFLDPGAEGTPDDTSWDGVAKWLEAQYRPGLHPSGQVPLQGLPPLDGLRALEAWMARQLNYRIVYLGPNRGFVPLPGPEVIRRRSGDCKDHASCFLAEASGLGFQGYPVICRINEGEVEPDPPVRYCFNHAIAALKLDKPLGLPAEVDTPAGRFLLVDTTDRFCPFGYLPSDHRNRRVLICTPGGGVWVTVPEAATLEPRLTVALTGTAQADGAVAVKASLKEQGNALGLRAWALVQGQEGLRKKLLATLFRLPSSGSLEVVASGDPLDLDHPFTVEVKVLVPDGFTKVGSAYALLPWALPRPRATIQKPGRARQGPVQIRSRTVWNLTADWDLPFPVRPRLASLKEENPFRCLSWSARAEDGKVHLAFHEETRDAAFPMDEREKGVALWKKDRALVERLGTEGCSFLSVAEGK